MNIYFGSLNSFRRVTGIYSGRESISVILITDPIHRGTHYMQTSKMIYFTRMYYFKHILQSNILYFQLYQFLNKLS